MSNKQAQPSTKIKLSSILVVTTTGQVIAMDMGKVELVDKATKEPLFKEKA